ncbi:PilZ domain-containing protein [Pseudomonas mangiferae]|uniref:PilZ domain-containing protein n=1 Tax=Pseudomonas mangiferae TaxID=2593654 RepID=A0A553H337_9PSED|nr:PilZ domain-containing protein [Pseudomonas mangiferae]TRX76147.1 PilZ domain-containing protein [Pseudomonas mangiferae]
MEERRHHPRLATDLRLEVQDLDSGQRLGRVVDLTGEGFMLFGEGVSERDPTRHCRLALDESANPPPAVHLRVDCLWTRPSADGRHCWAGFQVVELTEPQAASLDTLLDAL